MNRPGLTWHILYRFPTLYLAILATSALTWKLAPPAGIPQILSLIISLLFTVILLYSAARVMIIFEKRENLYKGEKTDKEKLAFLWENPETRLFLLLFLLLPLPLPAFKPIFGMLSPILRYLLSRLFVPFLAVAFLLGCMTGLAYYEQNEKKKEMRKKIRRSPIFFFFHVFKYVPIYAVASYCLLALSIVLFSLPGMIALFLTTSLGTAVVLIIAVLWIMRSVRGVRKRKRFLQQMKDACEMQGIPMPEIREPIRSLFRKKERGSIFEITVNKRKYVCKLISTLKPITIYRFYPNGEVGHVHVTYMHFNLRGHAFFGGSMLFRQRTELYEKRYNVAFEAEEGATKIFIFNPCSKTVEGQYGSETVPLDNGMKIGDYTFYTATGFTNALARNCLHRKMNE